MIPCIVYINLFIKILSSHKNCIGQKWKIILNVIIIELSCFDRQIVYTCTYIQTNCIHVHSVHVLY